MALAVECVKSDVVGTMVQKVFKCTFTSVTEGYFATGLNNVVFAIGNNETADESFSLKKNASSASVDVNGTIFITGVTSNDVVTVLALGN